MMKIFLVDDNHWVPEEIECSGFAVDKVGKYEPVLRLFDEKGDVLDSIVLTPSYFHIYFAEGAFLKNGSD